jgi:hypothetical protein
MMMRSIERPVDVSNKIMNFTPGIEVYIIFIAKQVKKEMTRLIQGGGSWTIAPIIYQANESVRYKT